MTKFQKPRYKKYLRLSKDIYQTFNVKKFSLEKWVNFKEKIKRRKRIRIKRQASPCLLKKKGFFDSFKNVRLKKNYKFSLINKQKLTNFYRLQNYKLKNLLYKNIKKKIKIFHYLERRLDVLLYKSGFFKTLYESQRYIHYQKISINGMTKLKSNHLVKMGDFIEINDSLLKKLIKKNLKTKWIYYFSYFKQQKHKDRYNIKLKIKKKKSQYQNLLNYQLYSYFYLQKLIKNRKKRFRVGLFFPITLEINYKTLTSICILGNQSLLDLKRSFTEYIHFIKISNFALKTL